MSGPNRKWRVVIRTKPKHSKYEGWWLAAIKGGVERLTQDWSEGDIAGLLYQRVEKWEPIGPKTARIRFYRLPKAVAKVDDNLLSLCLEEAGISLMSPQR